MTFAGVIGKERDVFSHIAKTKDDSEETRELSRRRRSTSVQTGHREIMPDEGNGQRSTIVVDVRELVAHLPLSLHKAKFHLQMSKLKVRHLQVAVTQIIWQVGDYILTTDMAVERKTLPDLKASINSGRLDNQMVAMCKRFKISILLIESEGRQFHHPSHPMFNKEMSPKCIISLVLLALRFSSLRFFSYDDTQCSMD